MIQEKLRPEEREIARRIWEITFDGEYSPLQKTRAFNQAPQKVREALYFATQQPEYRGKTHKNPFESAS